MAVHAEFVDELPGRFGTHQGRRAVWVTELMQNPGLWSKYPGSAKSVYKRAQFLSRDGYKFRAAIRDGVPYIRCEETP